MGKLLNITSWESTILAHTVGTSSATWPHPTQYVFVKVLSKLCRHAHALSMLAMKWSSCTVCIIRWSDLQWAHTLKLHSQALEQREQLSCMVNSLTHVGIGIELTQSVWIPMLRVHHVVMGQTEAESDQSKSSTLRQYSHMTTSGLKSKVLKFQFYREWGQGE